MGKVLWSTTIACATVPGSSRVRPLTLETAYKLQTAFLLGGEMKNKRQGVGNLVAESGVSGRTRLLPDTLAHALVVLHNTSPTGHETSHDG